MTFDLSGLRILVIDDTMDDRDLIDVMFGLHGADVVQASNVSEGLEAFAQKAPDLVVCDLLLGAGQPSGEVLVGKLARSPDDPGPRVPVVLLTGHERDYLPQPLLNAGFDEICGKPVSPDELLGIVARLTGRTVAAD